MDLIVQASQPAAQLLAHLGVERAERLIEQQHPWFYRQRARQGDALALAAGELVRVAVRLPVELHQFQQFAHPAPDLGVGRAFAARPHAQAEGDVFEYGHMAEQRVVLEHKADAAPLHLGIGGVLAIEQDLPAVRKLQACNHPQERGLARAGRAEQGHQFTRRNF